MKKFSKVLLTITCTLATCDAAYSQGENHIWAFGINAGLDFNSGNPEFYPTKSATLEGAASVCDKDGSLLFYCDGRNIWNREHKIMPNGDSILGNHGGWATFGSATQGVAIVPFINAPGMYYIFTVDCRESISGANNSTLLRYSVVDMSLDNGFGDVPPGGKNFVLDYGTSEKITVAKGAGCYFWLLTHKYGSPEFAAYKIGAAGISQAVSSFATTFDSSLFRSYKYLYMYGEMKVDADNKRLAVVTNSGVRGPRCIELFSFDNRTGIVSDPIRILDDPKNYPYGVSFSPGGRFLYAAPGDGRGDRETPLLQFDLSLLPDTARVRSSKQRVGPMSTWGGMRIGPDNKIYITGHNSNVLKVINHPDLKGDSCDVDTLGFGLPMGTYFQIGFGNNFLALNNIYFDNIQVAHDTFLCNEPGDYVSLHAPDEFENYLWSDGTNTRVHHAKRDIIQELWVRSTSYCGERTDTFKINHCANCIFIPNAFSPNGDGLNDWFGGFGDKIDRFEMHIYNRWGQILFTSAKIEQRWNGMYGASLCDVGTYFYDATVSCLNGQKFKMKGDFTLVR